MSSENKAVVKFNIKDYQELIDTLAKVEYKKLSSKHLIDFSELINIGNLYKRLAIYDMIYFLEQYVEHPEYEDLKEDVLVAAKIIVSNKK